jgi:hypothetical protein
MVRQIVKVEIEVIAKTRMDAWEKVEQKLKGIKDLSFNILHVETRRD